MGAAEWNIPAELFEDYVGSLIDQRRERQPFIMGVLCQRLRDDEVSLPRADAEEFRDLGGTDALGACGDLPWRALSASQQRLMALALVRSFSVETAGQTVSEQVTVHWRL